MTPAEFGQLLTAIRNNSIENVNLAKQGLDEAQIAEILQALVKNTSVRSINLSGNPISNANAVILGTVLNSATTAIEDLNLAWCGLTAEGVRGIAIGLATNKTVLNLDLDENPIMDHGVGTSALAGALETNDTLKVLSIDNQAHVKQIHDKIKVGEDTYATMLHYLILEDDVADLFNTLKANEGLEELTICCNKLDKESINALKGLITNHPSLHFVNPVLRPFAPDSGQDLSFIFDEFVKNLPPKNDNKVFIGHRPKDPNVRRLHKIVEEVGGTIIDSASIQDGVITKGHTGFLNTYQQFLQLTQAQIAQSKETDTQAATTDAQPLLPNEEEEIPAKKQGPGSRYN